MQPSIARRIVSAGRWQLVSNLVSLVVRFGVGIVLARLLPPSDFGLAALAMVVIGFATVVSDLGFAKAIIQRPALTERHERVALTTSTLFGIGFACIIVLLAPVGGNLAASSSLPRVLRALSLLFLVTGIDGIGRASLRRDLDFRRLFLIEVVSYVGGYGLIAITFAIAGLGVWSLVAGALVRVFCSSLLVIFCVRLPLRPLLCMVELRELLSFGAVSSVNGIVSFAARRSDVFLVGRLLGETALGLYSRAFRLMMLPVNYLTNVLLSVLFPAYSKVQSDRPRLRRGFLMSVQLTALATVPITVGMIVAAPHLIRGLYGEEWLGAVRPLQVLCIGALPRAMPSVASAVSHACDRVGTELILQIGFVGAVVAAVILGSTHGLVGVATFITLAFTYLYIATAWLALAITGATWWAFAKAQIPGCFVGVLTGGVAIATRAALEWAHSPSLVILFSLLVVSVIAGVLGLYILPPQLRPTELFRHISARPSWMPVVMHARLTGVLRV